jgi:hypothetical protein
VQVRDKPVQGGTVLHFCKPMENKSDEYYLSRCLARIEAIADRGNSHDWATYDFEKLSDSIYSRTQVRLSVTTLKRLWGRLQYNSAPTLTTLNVLAQFAGYADWRDFTRDENESQLIPPETIAPPSKQISRRPIFGLIGAVMLMAGVYFFFLSAGRKNPVYDSRQFEFSAHKMITDGVPNSVIFHYSAGVNPDSLFIVQTWDISRKTRVPIDKHEHSAIYYYPGFFRTKLIANEQVIKTHDLWITSGGWLCLLEDDPMPVYFDKERCLRNGVVEVDDAMLAPYRQTSTKPRVRFFNQRNLGDLMNDNFTFETKLKNNVDNGTDACRYTEVLIQCKNDIIIVPLAARSCVGNLAMYFCGTLVESKSADLSGFGADLSEWTSFRIETINKTATIYVNDKQAYTLTFPNNPTGIVGVQYRFNGAAATKETRFIANGKVYEMD